ncbi:hypothetical protein SMACR_05457 [Sordaria macrospora]|uniref:WGS project CABT00000000 data, contig 2.6 n=2 Tax=Sordaria macrospora TaxID=5147 RepID=F7VSZ9_SORMK|nr:uncharacterized protein SMAC_05457 [Sordaria macrospora k-hell]KAA8630285.1 hypothetical protein SMACR_05457 [Sordaria macrospora]KAH7628501.1 hypothetical protein B0T09DRAFT_162825 [Sordaria sp. MPI-SDFR-AT-0083]WPJ57556.1 hypothetical protein SMAC4_05457 [Sordaria macrospora]CCC08816.1 unnamed protein product [Sordaria macrospora k-hell]
MGSSASKPSAAAPHVWKGTAPAGVSQDLVEQLQSSPETDVSRQQTLELQVQARVAEELKRLRAAEAAKLQDTLTSSSQSTEQQQQEQQQENDAVSRQKVNKEVEALRAKLEERRKVRELPESMETARSEVVRCLRENDRRPLDCWKEVEAFKEEVRRLERGWVDKVVA